MDPQSVVLLLCGTLFGVICRMRLDLLVNDFTYQSLYDKDGLFESLSEIIYIKFGILEMHTYSPKKSDLWRSNHIILVLH